MATPRVSFRPNHPKDKEGNLVNELRPILVEFYCKEFRIELSTGLKVYPANFSHGRATSKEKDFRNINTELSRIETEILGVSARSVDEMKSLIRAAVRGESISYEKKTVHEVETWIGQFIDTASVKEKTRQVYNSSFVHLLCYTIPNHIRLTWDSFTLEFYDGFMNHLYSQEMCDNTAGKIIKTIKTFLSEAFERDIHTNLVFKKKGFKVTSAQVDEIYLTETEIDKFEAVDLSNNPELLPSQKLFLFACEVGLRFSDLGNLTPNNLVIAISGPRLDVTTKKTGEDVKVSLTARAKRIWDSWKGYPPKIANPVFNENIKIIAARAGIDQQVQRRNTIKGVVTIEWLPKFKMVTAHTARRSFATNSYNRGIPVQTIMHTTGHKTEKTFRKYLLLSGEEHAVIQSRYQDKELRETAEMKMN